MEAHTRVTLAISPGTRSVGFAVLKEARLISWNVKTFSGTWRKEKAKHIMSAVIALIKYYEPRAVVIKKVDPVRSSIHLSNLYEDICVLIEKEKIRRAQCTIHDMYEFCGVPTRNIHKAIADTAVDLYPELRHEYLREINSQRPHYQKMFEAVVAARWYIERNR